MAISWGSWVNNTSGNGMRVGVEFSQSPSSVGTGTTSVTVTAEFWVETKAPVSESSNTVNIGGDFSFSGSIAFSHGTGGGTTRLRTMSRTVSTSYTSTRSTSASISLSGVNAIPGTASESASWTTGKRPYTAPNAVSNLKTSRSGTSIALSWTRNPTTAKPYDNIRIRESVNGGSYSDVALLSGGATSYTRSGRTPNSSYKYAVRAENDAGSSAWAYGSTITIPPNSPAAPSNATVERSSDTRQIIRWTRGTSTSTAPITNQVIARRDVYGANTYVNIATVSGTVTSFTDSSTQANKQYQYRVQSKNSAATSAWTYTDYMSTTPNPPTNVKAQKQGADILVTWTNVTGTRITAIEVWTTADGVDQSPVFIRIDGQPTSYLHTNPDPSKTWAYRLKTQSGMDANDSAPNLYSAFSARSNTVQLLTPPNAPSNLVPGSGAMDGDDAIKFSWKHNPIDTTDQTAYQLRYRIPGDVWTDTGKVTGTNEFVTFPAGTFNNGQPIEWQVRTWGDHADPSPYSTTATVNMSSRPSVTILSPDGVEDVRSSRFRVEWNFFDPEGTTQTSVRVQLKDANGVSVYSRTLSGSMTYYSVPYTLSDGGDYVVVVSGRDGSGLWSFETEQPFHVTYAKPPVAVVEPIWDIDLGAVAVSIMHPAPTSTQVAAVSCDLQWSANGEDWTTVAEGLEPTTSTVDFIPALDTVNYYRVISYSSLPSSLESPPAPVVVESGGWLFVNGGNDWSIVCRVKDALSTQHAPLRTKVTNHFAGRSYPVMTTGQSRTRVISASARLGRGSSSSAEWEALMDTDGPVCYREPQVNKSEQAVRLFAVFKEYSVSRGGITQEVSMSFDQVEGF